MHLPWAYRSLARPSSALEPSHPPEGIITRVHLTLSSERLIYACVYTISLWSHWGCDHFILPRQHYLPGALIWTCWDSNPRPSPCKGDDLPTDLQARSGPVLSGLFKPIGSGSFSISDRLWWLALCQPCLGGDPAADSPTATLLRLNPPCKI
jgi:hypothetical protein